MELQQAKKDLETALSNSFDTPAVMRLIQQLVRDANIYMDKSDADLQAVEFVARWVTKIVGILGLDADAQPPYDGLGWSSATAIADSRVYAAVLAKVQEDVLALNLSEPSIKALLDQSPQSEVAELEKSGERDPEKLALPYVRAVSRIRDELRRIVSSLTPDVKKLVLALSDRIRDYDLADLGVQLDDQADKPSLIKFVPAAKLIAAREEKAALVAEKARQKEEARKAKEKADQEKWEKAKLAPQDMFKEDKKYQEWDADGIPTKLADGSDLPKSQQKKLKKDWDRQKKLHQEYQTKFGTGA